MSDFTAAAKRCSPAHRAWILAGAASIFAICLLGGPQLLADPDTQWHIAAGRTMLETWSWPRVDTMSHTFAGKPWIAKEWLAQVMFAGAFAIGGWACVAALTAAAAACAMALVMAANCQRQGPLACVAAGFVSLLIIAATLVARPHVLAFPLIASWTIALMRGAERGTPPWWALGLMVLWANTHAAFTMGFVIAAAFGLEALLRAEPAARIRTFALWLAFGVGCLVASLVTPYGAQPLLLNLTMASGNEAIQYIGEWKPLGLDGRTAYLVGFAFVAMSALAQQDLRRNFARIALLVVLTYMMIRHERFVMVFGIVAPVIAFPPLAALMRGLADRLNLFKADGPVGSAAPLAIAGAGLAAAVALLVTRAWMPPAKVAPVEALAAVPETIRRQPVFNSYDLGGFLAFNRIPTFIDGRTDQLFLGGFMTRMSKAAGDDQPAQLSALLDDYKIGWAIVGTTKPESDLMPQIARWQELKTPSSTARVFVRVSRAAAIEVTPGALNLRR